jgi:hypothetical protein
VWRRFLTTLKSGAPAAGPAFGAGWILDGYDIPRR